MICHNLTNYIFNYTKNNFLYNNCKKQVFQNNCVKNGKILKKKNFNNQHQINQKKMGKHIQLYFKMKIPKLKDKIWLYGIEYLKV